jgi:transaldolase
VETVEKPKRLSHRSHRSNSKKRSIHVLHKQDNFSRYLHHVTQAALAGADLVTVPPPVMKLLLEHPLTDKGMASFLGDWKKTGQTIL